uniref:hypothetical protein n=1 Tax=Belnapia moabensis TaxID=365533 RepID=UPI001B7FFD9D
GHGEAPLLATLNQSAVSLGIPRESCSRRLGISYREDAADRRDVAVLAAQAGFTVIRNGTRELAL